MVKKTLRHIVKGLAVVAAAVFVLDNRSSGTAGIVLMGSIGLMGICLIVLLVLGQNEESNTTNVPPSSH